MHGGGLDSSRTRCLCTLASYLTDGSTVYAGLVASGLKRAKAQLAGPSMLFAPLLACCRLQLLGCLQPYSPRRSVHVLPISMCGTHVPLDDASLQADILRDTVGSVNRRDTVGSLILQ